MSGASAAVSRLRGSVTVLHREIAKFGAVGALAWLINLGIFNALSLGVLDGHEKLALAIAGAVSILFAWVGSRYWTFRHRQRTDRAPFMTFVVVNVVGAAIAVVCLTVSHDLLGLTSHLADNISGNIVGVGLGTIFRFWAYRAFVFREYIDPQGRDRAEDPEAEPLPLDSRRPADAPSAAVPVTQEPPHRAAG